MYTAAGTREFGLVNLPDGQSVVEILVHEGTVKLRDDASKNASDPASETVVEKLRVFEQQARDAGKGVWSSADDGVIATNYETPENTSDLLAQFKVAGWRGRALAGAAADWWARRRTGGRGGGLAEAAAERWAWRRRGGRGRALAKAAVERWARRRRGGRGGGEVDVAAERWTWLEHVPVHVHG